MLREKRRDTEIFSLSFMDCICCGFGAVLLLFILTTGQKADFTQEQLDDLKARVKDLEDQITVEKSELERTAKPATITPEELAELLRQNATDQQKLTLDKEQLQLLLQQLGALKDAQAKLLAEKANLPKEEVQPVPIPNVDRRQYLTGVKLEGSHVLFIVRTSGSMLGDSLEDAIGRLEDPDFKKREAPKWQRVIKALDWLVANLGPETNFQILLFNEETVPLLPNRTGGTEWIARSDRQGVQEALTRLRQVVPGGSANLERAFTTLRYLPTLPDAVVLITDGLPTTSDTSPNLGTTDDATRMQYLRHALRQLPPRIPVSTILFPTTGDPGAPALYWELSDLTRGALVSPSANWPDT